MHRHVRLRAIARLIVLYYTALKLHAGAATALLADRIVDEPPPFVLMMHDTLQNGFDRRELIEHRDRTYVVILVSDKAACMSEN